MILRQFIVNNPWFRAAVAVAFVQQCLVAGGTYLLGDITAHLPISGLSWSKCILLLVCMSFSGSLLFYALQLFSLRSQRTALKSFFAFYFQRTYNQPNFWRHNGERQKRHDMMCREAQDAIHEGNTFFLDLWTTGWNIILNTLSVVLVIGAQSGAVILTVGLVSSLLVHFASDHLSKTAIDEMDDQNQINAHLGKSWDNLTLGNALSFGLWRNKFENLFSRANASAEESLKARERILATGNFFTTVAIVGSAFTQAYLNKTDISSVIALFAMLPRTLQINMHVQIVQHSWASWQRIRERLNMAAESVSQFPKTQAEQFIRKDGIEIVQSDSNETLSPSELLKSARSLRVGRITVRGPNGTGKSVLLSIIKEQLADDAYYLPAHHSLDLPGVEHSLSHGEKAKAALQALALSNHQVLLLDEWDANLSLENRHALSARIAALAEERLVIEVRHNTDSNCVGA
ncbi:hypothetical protein EBU99_09490 [bacterium]|nr:hypothetical protein [bacterium]